MQVASFKEKRHQDRYQFNSKMLFTFQNYHKNLDSSCKTDLEFFNYFGRQNLDPSCKKRIFGLFWKMGGGGGGGGGGETLSYN